MVQDKKSSALTNGCTHLLCIVLSLFKKKKGGGEGERKKKEKRKGKSGLNFGCFSFLYNVQQTVIPIH